MRTEKHTFVICAYKESAFLEECVKSLVKQTIQSKMLMVTSTPNAHSAHIAEKYGIPLLMKGWAELLRIGISAISVRRPSM